MFLSFFVMTMKSQPCMHARTTIEQGTVDNNNSSSPGLLQQQQQQNHPYSGILIPTVVYIRKRQRIHLDRPTDRPAFLKIPWGNSSFYRCKTTFLLSVQIKKKRQWNSISLHSVQTYCVESCFATNETNWLPALPANISRNTEISEAEPWQTSWDWQSRLFRRA